MNEFRIQYKFPGEKAKHLRIGQPTLAGVIQVLRVNYGVEVTNTEELIIHEIVDGGVRVCLEHEQAAEMVEKPHVKWSAKYGKYVTQEELARLDAMSLQDDVEEEEQAMLWDDYINDRGGYSSSPYGNWNRNYDDVYEEKENRIINGVIKMIEDMEDKDKHTWKRHQVPRERYSVKKYAK